MKKNVQKITFLSIMFLCLAIIQLKAQGNQQQLLNRYVGQHPLTLQWFGKEMKAGKAVISQKEGTFVLKIKGEQRKSATEFLTIEGTIEPISAIEFKFIGKITSQISFINKGEVCVKDGTYTFKKWNGRAFWRLQEKDNCEGNSVVDYVDIF